MLDFLFRRQKKPVVVGKKLIVEVKKPFAEVSKPIVEALEPVVEVRKPVETQKPVVEVPRPATEEITEKMSTRLMVGSGMGSGTPATTGGLSVPARRHGKSQSAFVS